MATGDIRVSITGLDQLDQLVPMVAGLYQRLDHLEEIVATQEDADRITAAVTGFADRLETSIAGIRQDFADFKAANPTVDLAALEDTVNTRLGAIATDAAELDSENPAPSGP